MEFVEFIRDLNFWTVLIRLVLALLLGGFVGYERQRKGHAAGLRTHILVCLGAAMTTLTGMFASEVSGMSSDPMRIGAQVVSGIGFIGAGTILVTKGMHIRGLTTAAGLWSTAAIGLALGTGFYEGALICTFLIVLVISRLKFFDDILYRKKKYIELYIEVSKTANVNSVLDSVKELGIDISEARISAPKSACPGNVGISIEIFSNSKDDKLLPEGMPEKIKELEHVDIVLVNS